MIKVADLVADLSLNARGFTAGLASAKGQMEGFARGAEQSARKAQAAGRTMTRRMTLPIIGMGTAVVATASSYEASMNRVAALTRASGDTMEMMEGQAKELGRTTMFSASQAADGMGFFAQAGFEANQITAAMPGTLDLAAAGQLDLARAADISSNVLTGFGESADQANRVADLLAATSIKTNTNVEQLGEAMKFVAPVAASAGVSMEETAAAIGLLGNAGIQGSMAGTTLRGAIAKLLSPTNQAAASIERLGLNVTDSEGRLRPFDQIVRQLEESGATTADMMEIFGLRAGPGMAALVQQGGDALQQMNADLQDAGGTAKEVADRQMEGFRGQLMMLKSAAEGLAIAVAESGLLEFVTGLAESLTGLISSLAETNPGVLKFATVLLGMVAIAGPLTSLFGSLLSGVNAVAGVFGLASVSAGALLSVLGPIAVAIGALLIIGKVTDHFLNYGASVEDVTESMKEFAETGETTAALAETMGAEYGNLAETFADAESRTGVLARGFVFLSDVVTAATLGFVSIDTTAEQAVQKFEALDSALTNLVTSGEMEAAATNFGAMMTEANAAGISFDEMLDRLPNLEDALNDAGTGADQLALLIRAGIEPAEAFERVMVGVDEATGTTTRSIEAQTGRMNAMASAFGQAVGDVDDVEHALGEAGIAADEAAEAMDRAREKWDVLTGRFLDQQSTLISVERGFGDLKTNVDETSRSLDLQTEAGRTNQQAIIDQITQLGDYRDAQIRAGTSTNDANANLRDQVKRLEDQLVALGFSREEIAEYVRDVLKIPADRQTVISSAFDAGGLDAAKRAIRDFDAGTIPISFEARLDDLTRVRDRLRRDGVDTSRIPDFRNYEFGGRLRGAGIVGEAGPELFIPDQTGTVIPNDELRRMIPMPDGPSSSSRGSSSGQDRMVSKTTNVEVYAQTNADPWAIADEVAWAVG